MSRSFAELLLVASFEIGNDIFGLTGSCCCSNPRHDLYSVEFTNGESLSIFLLYSFNIGTGVPLGSDFSSTGHSSSSFSSDFGFVKILHSLFPRVYLNNCRLLSSLLWNTFY